MRTLRAAALLTVLTVLATGCAPGPTVPPPDPAPTTVAAAPRSSPAPSAPGPSAAPPGAVPPGSPPDRSPAATPPADPGSPAVVVNKRRPLVPATWSPPALEEVGGVRLRPEAAAAARALLAAAREDGVAMRALSGYRSYDEQAATYAGWVAQQGQEAADTASARPGHSEHQTGLALDVGEGTGCDLQVCFAGTAAAAWVAEHGPEHGFVVRYPLGEHGTTGYWYEPWHLRYLGPERARAFARSGSATLEEFSGLAPAPDYGTR